jgi:ABC-type uncharacterized transport system substrate-binding protein
MAGIILWCLLALTPAFCRAENLRLLVVLSDSTPAYKAFANTLSHSLPASVQATVVEQPGEMKAPPQADLIVALGMNASLAALSQTGTPVLASMIPQTGYRELLAQTPRPPPVSAVYMDQPWGRQLDFVRAILPSRARFGLLHSGSAALDLDFLEHEAAERGITLVSKPVQSAENLFPALNGLLAGSDVLVALPDNKIYNSNNIRNILLSSYRAGVPFIGLSQSYVTAGALGAVFASPQQLSTQIAEAVLSFARTRKLPDPQYSRDFSVALNPEVARSLGIELPPADVIRNRMNDMSRNAQ